MSAALVRIPTRCVARGPLPDAAGPGPKSLRAVNLAGASISVSLQSTAALAASQSPSTEELQGVFPGPAQSRAVRRTQAVLCSSDGLNA